MVETTTTLFTFEIRYNSGELEDSSRLFSGRGGLWEEYLNQFASSSFLEKSIGFGINSGRTYNKFLRILILSCFFAYSLFIILLISKALKIYFKSQLSFLVLFSIAVILIDSISEVWGLYQFYLIVLVGFYISSIHEIKNNDNQ